MIPLGKDFFSEPRALGGSFIWAVVYSNVSLDLRYQGSTHQCVTPEGFLEVGSSPIVICLVTNIDVKFL